MANVPAAAQAAARAPAPTTAAAPATVTAAEATMAAASVEVDLSAGSSAQHSSLPAPLGKRRKGAYPSKGKPEMRLTEPRQLYKGLLVRVFWSPTEPGHLDDFQYGTVSEVGEEALSNKARAGRTCTFKVRYPKQLGDESGSSYQHDLEKSIVEKANAIDWARNVYDGAQTQGLKEEKEEVEEAKSISKKAKVNTRTLKVQPLRPRPPGHRVHTLPTLTEEELQRVAAALHEPDTKLVEEGLVKAWDPHEMLADFRNIPITRGDMATLRPGQWLNDEVLNFFFKLLQQREESKMDPALPSCHFHQTNFYTKLAECRGGYKYDEVARWTRNMDVLGKDLIMVPIHLHGNHWTLAVINMKQNRFEYYDSLYYKITHYDHRKVFRNLRRWLQDESLNKKNRPFDTSGWEDVVWKRGETPGQIGGKDCGVFMSRTAEWLALGAVLSFTQGDIGFLRQLTVLEILNGRLHGELEEAPRGESEAAGPSPEEGVSSKKEASADAIKTAGAIEPESALALRFWAIHGHQGTLEDLIAFAAGPSWRSYSAQQRSKKGDQVPPGVQPPGVVPVVPPAASPGEPPEQSMALSAETKSGGGSSCGVGGGGGGGGGGDHGASSSVEGSGASFPGVVPAVPPAASLMDPSEQRMALSAETKSGGGGGGDHGASCSGASISDTSIQNVVQKLLVLVDVPAHLTAPQLAHLQGQLLQGVEGTLTRGCEYLQKAKSRAPAVSVPSVIPPEGSPPGKRQKVQDKQEEHDALLRSAEAKLSFFRCFDTACAYPTQWPESYLSWPEINELAIRAGVANASKKSMVSVLRGTDWIKALMERILRAPV